MCTCLVHNNVILTAHPFLINKTNSDCEKQFSSSLVGKKSQLLAYMHMLRVQMGTWIMWWIIKEKTKDYDEAIVMEESDNAWLLWSPIIMDVDITRICLFRCYLKISVNTSYFKIMF